MPTAYTTQPFPERASSQLQVYLGDPSTFRRGKNPTKGMLCFSPFLFSVSRRNGSERGLPGKRRRRGQTADSCEAPPARAPQRGVSLLPNCVSACGSWLCSRISI